MAHQKTILRDHISPEAIANQLKRLYGGAACVEALWHLQRSTNGDIENRRFWGEVLSSLDVPGTGELELTPALVAKLYQIHLADPWLEAWIRIREAQSDGSKDKAAFWHMVLGSLPPSRTASLGHTPSSDAANCSDVIE